MHFYWDPVCQINPIRGIPSLSGHEVSQEATSEDCWGLGMCNTPTAPQEFKPALQTSKFFSKHHTSTLEKVKSQFAKQLTKYNYEQTYNHRLALTFILFLSGV